MDSLGSRNLTRQLADDLGWLEQHCRRQPEQTAQAGLLHLASALVRNCVGPFLEGQSPSPLHLAVVGGAGAGKSTVVNLLNGAAVAEANPQAGFTRHPVGYTSNAGPLTWSGHPGFLGTLQLQAQEGPANLDADVYQIRRLPQEASSLARDLVVWDCPDMTTWAATGYVPRLLEVAALADVLVYVASDERYNDAVPTQYLDLLVQTGKPVVACLMKMHEADISPLMNHFRTEVVARLHGPVVACLAIPFLSPEELAEPGRMVSRFRLPLLNQVAVLSRPAELARQRVVHGAVHFLVKNQEKFLETARQDVNALQGWHEVVKAGQVEFENRYRREYLASSKYRHFDEALVRLIELLELPGVGRFISGTLWVLRTPYRFLRGLVSKAMSRPEAPSLPEQPILEEALNGWLDLLRKEAARRADTHPLWAHIEAGFNGEGLADQVRERFQQGFRSYQLGLAEEVSTTAQAIYNELEKSPARLNTLRGGKLALDVAAILAALVAGGISWHDFILVPLAASVTHQLVELLGKQYVDSQREQARQRQFNLMVQDISQPLAERLIQWPATGGSAFERLQQALQRLPSGIGQLYQMVHRKGQGQGS